MEIIYVAVKCPEHQLISYLLSACIRMCTMVSYHVHVVTRS